MATKELTEEQKQEQLKKASKIATWQGCKVYTYWLPILKALDKIVAADYAHPLSGAELSESDKAEAKQEYYSIIQFFLAHPDDPDATFNESLAYANSPRVMSLAKAAAVDPVWLTQLAGALWDQWTLKGQAPTQASPGLLSQYNLHAPKAGKTPARSYKSKPSQQHTTDYETENYVWITVAVVAGSLIVLALTYYFLIYRPKHKALPAA